MIRATHVNKETEPKTTKVWFNAHTPNKRAKRLEALIRKRCMFLMPMMFLLSRSVLLLRRAALLFHHQLFRDILGAY